MSNSRDLGVGIGDSEVQEHMHDGEVIRAEGLAKTYAEGSLRTPVFDGLDLAVQAGETVAIVGASRSEEHTSELQSLMRISYAVFCLKKKKYNTKQKNT